MIEKAHCMNARIDYFVQKSLQTWAVLMMFVYCIFITIFVQKHNHCSYGTVVNFYYFEIALFEWI